MASLSVSASDEPVWLPLHFETPIPQRPTGGRELHVSPQGHDGGDGSAAKPWKTLAHAVAQLKAGDTLTLAAGQYKENVTLKASGTEKAWIVIRSAPGAQAVICGDDGIVLTLEPGVAFVRLENLEIASGSHGLRCNNSKAPANAPVRDLDVIGCYFHDLRGVGVKLYRVERALVHSCRFTKIPDGGAGFGTGDGGAKDVKVVNCKSWNHNDGQGAAGDSDGFHAEGGAGFLFEACEVRDVTEDGIDCKGGNVAIRNCRVVRAHNGFKLWTAPIRVENCVVQDVAENALKLAAEAGRADEIRVRSSTFVNAGDILAVFSIKGPVGRLSIRDCILAGGRKALIGTWKDGVSLELDADHNVYADSPLLLATSKQKFAPAAWDEFAKATGGQAHARYVASMDELKLEKLAEGQPAPAAGSPAFEAGDPAQAAPADPLGRPRGKKPNIGAY